MAFFGLKVRPTGLLELQLQDGGLQGRAPRGISLVYSGVKGDIWVVVKIMVPFLGTLNIRGRIIVGIQKGAIILTTTHIYKGIYIYIYV